MDDLAEEQLIRDLNEIQILEQAARERAQDWWQRAQSAAAERERWWERMQGARAREAEQELERQRILASISTTVPAPR